MRDDPHSQPWHRQILLQLRGYVIDDLALKALAALIVTALWLSVAGQNRPRATATLRAIDVLLENLPPNLIVTSTEPPLADITVRGPEDVIRELRIPALRASDLVAIADLSGRPEGVHIVPLRLQGLPDDVSQVPSPPATVRVTLEPLRTRDVPVEVRLVGTPPPGYRVAGTHVSPAVVTLRGAESQIAALESIMTTTVSLTNRTEPFEESVDLDVTGADIFPVGSSRVAIRVDVQPELEERTFDGVAVTSTAGEAMPATVSVTVRGPIAAVTSIAAADISVTAVPDGEGSETAHPKAVVTSPAGAKIEIVGVSPSSLRLRRP